MESERTTTRPPILTIGIPTYRRCATVVQRIEELLGSGLPSAVEVLVLDNASPDGTFETLSERCAGTRIRVLRNAQNIGFAGSFLRLFEEATGEYLLIASDEDPVLTDALPALLDFCADMSPRFVSPQVFMERGKGPELYRGRRKTSHIRPEAFGECAFYVSGVTYHVASARELVPVLNVARTTNAAVDLYPQVLLAAGLIARGECYWLDRPLTAATDTREQLATHASGLDDVPYAHLSSRWAQFLGRDDFLGELKGRASLLDEQTALDRMRDASARGLYDVLRYAVESERPGLAGELDAGARRHLLQRNRLLRRAAFVADDPREAAAEVWRRVAALRRKA